MLLWNLESTLVNKQLHHKAHKTILEDYKSKDEI
jgi:hypothetical protein